MSAIDRTRYQTVRCAVAALLLAVPALALGQPPIVTDADIVHAQHQQPVVSDEDIARARQRYTPKDQAPPAPRPRPLNVDALPVPDARDALDLGAIAEGFQRSTPAPRLGAEERPTLLVFVSLSMPEPALRQLIAQAARARAQVVIRGFVGGSLRQTAARLQSLIGQSNGSVQIDPRPFTQYGIDQVPAFVLTRATPTDCDQATCVDPGGYIRTSGDVTLDYALAYMQRTAPAWSPSATIYLRRLER